MMNSGELGGASARGFMAVGAVRIALAARGDPKRKCVFQWCLRYLVRVRRKAGKGVELSRVLMALDGQSCQVWWDFKGVCILG